MPIYDGLAVMGFSLLQLFLNPIGYASILSYLAGLTVLTGDALFAFDQKARWRLGIAGICMVIYPEFLFAFPIFTYKAGQKQQWLFPTLGGAVGIVQFLLGAVSPASLCLALLSAAAAWLSAVKSGKIALLREQLILNTDSSRERSLLMEEKNKALREKQDYEIYTATLQERNRIAREIHDNVGHLLSRSILLAGAIKTINRDEGLRQPLYNLEESLNTAMTSIRSSVHDLHDEAVDLQTASRELMKTFTFCRTDFVYDMSRSVPRNIKYCFLTILKEGLNNVMKHSNGDYVEVRMREQPGLYQLVIRDNGRNAQVQENGIGLTNMAQRVQELGGCLHIHCENGFEIFITIPRRCED